MNDFSDGVVVPPTWQLQARRNITNSAGAEHSVQETPKPPASRGGVGGVGGVGGEAERVLRPEDAGGGASVTSAV